LVKNIARLPILPLTKQENKTLDELLETNS